MTAISQALPYRSAIREASRSLRRFRPPVRAARFWIVQAGVLSIALFHDVMLDDFNPNHVFSVGDAMTSAFLLIPVIYAALNFGVHGSIATALWATALTVPHWLLMPHLSRSHLVIELGNLAILYVVAIVVGQRVENEQRARQRAESTLRIARTASERYQSLFEQQPAPVIIADWSGTIGEVNTAATRVFGPVTAGSALQDLLSATAPELVADEPPCLSLRTVDGDQRLFVPSAHALEVDRKRLLQIVLTDVTEQYRRQEEQRLYSGRLLTVQEDERRRLAQELHDDPLQSLMYLARMLDGVSEDVELPTALVPMVRHGRELAAETASTLRKVIHGLRPPVLDDIGIVSALRQLVTDVGLRTGLPVGLRVTGTEGSLAPDLKLTVYRIVQESLNNVVRHAHASHATVWVRFGPVLTLSISDNGRGISRSPEPEDCSRTGLGIIGMHERATLVGGTLRVGSRSPHGTIVRATLPRDTPPRNTALQNTALRQPCKPSRDCDLKATEPSGVAAAE